MDREQQLGEFVGARQQLRHVDVDEGDPGGRQVLVTRARRDARSPGSSSASKANSSRLGSVALRFDV